MKRVLLALFLLYLWTSTAAQKQNNNWCIMGDKVLNFDNNIANLREFNGPNLYDANISDESGNLLFGVANNLNFDKNGNSFSEWTTLGNASNYVLFQLIIPLPLSTSLYYVLKVDSKNVLKYDIVDVTRNHGLCEVIGQKIIASDFLPILNAFPHKNGIDYWIVVASASPTNFYSFQLTPDGILPNPRITPLPFDLPTYGYQLLRFAPDGSMFATTNNWLEIYLFDFDTSDGGIKIHSHTKLPDNQSTGYYEFSPNSRYLYVNAMSDGPIIEGWGEPLTNNDILQYDTKELQRPPYLVAQKKQTSIKDSFWSDLKLAPDNKIYMDYSGSWFAPNYPIFTIENPDGFENLCGGVTTKFVFEQYRNTRERFPQSLIRYQPSRSIVAFNQCISQPQAFKVNSTLGVLSLLWQFGDGQTSTETEPSHSYASEGKFIVNVEIKKTDNTTEILSKGIEIFAKPQKPTIIRVE